jgi:multiple sugar transport system substrate-binding protein
MKRVAIAGIVFVFVAVFSFANGSQENTASGTATTTTVQYAFWGNPDAIGVEDDIIKAFEAQNPSIKITPVVSGYSDYHTKLLTLIAGGAAPDVMRVDSYFFGDFLKAGALREISDLIKKSNIDLKAYYPEGIEENSHDGKIYGLPWGTAPLYMMMNVKMFKDAGVALPPMSWNWNDFVSIVKQLTKGSGTDKQYGFALSLADASVSAILPWVWENGGDLFDASRTHFTLDQPAAYEAIQRMAELYKQGYMPPDALNSKADVLDRWFVNDKLAMYIGSAAEILTVQKVPGVEFEAWSMPNGNVKRTTVYKSNIIGISPQTKHLDQAWQFLQFLRGPKGEGETLYMKAHRIPPTIDDAKYWALYADPTKYPKLIAKNTTEISDMYGRLLPLRAGWLEIQQILTPALQSVFLGQTSAEQAMKLIAPKVQAVLDRNTTK